MNERSTTELETPSGHKVIIKEYVTAREMMPLLKSGEQSPTAAGNVDRALQMMEIAIVSIDGSTQNCIETIQDFPLQDYLFLTQEVAKLANFQKTKS